MTDIQTSQERISFLRSLRAIRQFRPDPVPQEVIDAVLEVARWSGSAINRQPWELIVIRKSETLRALASAEGYTQHLANAPSAIVLVMAGEQATQETYDEGRLSERIMLAAAAYGLGSCIGWFIDNGVATAKNLLGIPEGRTVRTAISLGYPDEDALSKRPKSAQARKQISEIVHWEQY
jgi:nitroreductase